MAVQLDLACRPPRAPVHMMERPVPDGALGLVKVFHGKSCRTSLREAAASSCVCWQLTIESSFAKNIVDKCLSC